MEEGSDMGKVPSTNSCEPKDSHPALSQTYYGKQCIGVNFWRAGRRSWRDKEYLRAFPLAVSKTGSFILETRDHSLLLLSIWQDSYFYFHLDSWPGRYLYTMHFNIKKTKTFFLKLRCLRQILRPLNKCR